VNPLVIRLTMGTCHNSHMKSFVAETGVSNCGSKNLQNVNKNYKYDIIYG